MIKCRWLPAGGGVTVFAGFTFRTAMHIFSAVAGNTSHWRALEDSTDMAGCARNRSMFTSQFESRQVMVKSCALPVGCGMACATVCAISPGVMIIFLMAGATA